MVARRFCCIRANIRAAQNLLNMDEPDAYMDPVFIRERGPVYDLAD